MYLGEFVRGLSVLIILDGGGEWGWLAAYITMTS